MDRLIDRLPSPAGLALWLYAAVFVLLPAFLAYKGLTYLIGVVIFAVGVRPHVESLVAGRRVHFAFHWRGRRYAHELHLGIANEAWVNKILSWFFMGVTVLILPLLVFVLQSQGQLFYAQIETQLPAILEEIGRLLDFAHEQLPGYVPDVDVDRSTGWSGLSALFGQVAGDAVADIKGVLQSALGSVLGVVGTLLGDWVKLVIAALLVGTILAGWRKEVEMHRGVVSRGIKAPRLRDNVLRFGELYQTGVSLFMIGYLEVAATLTVLYAIAMVVLPLGLSPGAILFMAVVLGFVTAIPKIGGFGGMAVAFLLMATNIQAGLGWFGFEVVSFGTGLDVLIRTAALIGVAKIMGLLEAYNYTPHILGEKLGMTKMQIIATVMIWAVGAGFFGMIWGILISLTFQAALRLAEEDAARQAAEAGIDPEALSEDIARPADAAE
ncbi:MAG: AI-2E family transporter [Paracoccaceae bacterium]